jgi:hypothetical protein
MEGNIPVSNVTLLASNVALLASNLGLYRGSDFGSDFASPRLGKTCKFVCEYNSVNAASDLV